MIGILIKNIEIWRSLSRMGDLKYHLNQTVFRNVENDSLLFLRTIAFKPYNQLR